MKTTLSSVLAILLAAAIQVNAQNKKVTVEAANRDISYYLDLKAVASVFAEAKNLEDFEMLLNDYNSDISNLDLNDDGEIDYLRVVETSEKGVHLVVIQAVLGPDIYQDVATVFVERENTSKATVRIVGDPYIYGANYIIEPIYYTTPVIFSWFWTPRYARWHSPYYWGYYPNYYHRRPIIAINIYMHNVHRHIDRHNHYSYGEYRHNDRYDRMRNSISRNDYGRNHPERDFGRRNVNTKVTSKRDFDMRDRDNNRTLRENAVNRGNSSRISSDNRTNGSRVSSETRTKDGRTNAPSRTNSDNAPRTRESVNAARPNVERKESPRVTTPARTERSDATSAPVRTPTPATATPSPSSSNRSSSVNSRPASSPSSSSNVRSSNPAPSRSSSTPATSSSSRSSSSSNRSGGRR